MDTRKTAVAVTWMHLLEVFVNLHQYRKPRHVVIAWVCCVFEQFYGYLSPKLAALNMDPSFLDRNVNEGFSGGEKKRNEILQLAVTILAFNPTHLRQFCFTNSLSTLQWHSSDFNGEKVTDISCAF